MSHRCGLLYAQRAGSMVPMRTAMLVRAVVHVTVVHVICLRGHSRISGSQPRGRPEYAAPPSRRSRNLPARSADHGTSRNNYRPSLP